MGKLTFKILVIFFVLIFFSTTAVKAEGNLADKLSGRILLQVESVGQAWYIEPDNNQRAFLGRPADAFRIMRELGLGISEESYDSFNGYAPDRLSGKILLRVEANGEAYYVFPDDLKMHYLGRPSDAFQVMREKGLGITDKDLEEVPVFEKYKEQVEENTSAINELTKKVNGQQEIIENLLKNNESDEPIPEPEPIPKPTSESSSSGQSNQEEPLITFCHLADLEDNTTFNAGSSNIVFFAFKISANQLIQLNSIKLVHSGSGSLPDLVNLNLYEYSTGVLLGSYDSALLFQNLNKTLNGEETFIVKGNLSSDTVNKQTHKFSILSNSQLDVEPIAVVNGLPIESGEVTIRREDISLGINNSSNSPTGIIDTLDTNVTLGSFNITASGEDVKLQELAIVIDRSNIDNGGYAESLRNGKIYFSGAQVGSTQDIIEGNSSVLWENGTIFHGINVTIRDGQTIELCVRADIYTNGTPFQTDDTIKVILLAGTNNALSSESSVKLSTNKVNGNSLAIRKLGTISVEKSASWAGCESTESCQDRILGNENVKIGEFIIRAFSTVEDLIFKRIKLEDPFNENDYTNFFITDLSGKTVGSYSILDDYSYAYCHINPNVKLLDENIFSIYANIVDNPESSGINPYQGIKILEALIIGETTEKEVNSFEPVVLQKLYIAP